MLGLRTFNRRNVLIHINVSFSAHSNYFPVYTFFIMNKIAIRSISVGKIWFGCQIYCMAEQPAECNQMETMWNCL